MQTIGIIGGMSWESTALYYRQINEAVRQQLGGLHSAKILLYSVDFAPIAQLQYAGDWHAAGVLLADVAQTLAAGGADLLVLATNTMHVVAPQIQEAVAIPLLHIADPTGSAITAAGITTVGLLGTRFTMEQPFYCERLQEVHGLTVLVPDTPGREIVHRIIYEELCLGIISPESRAAYQQVMADLIAAGAQAIILGCTEITLLVGAGDATVPLFDTTALHARAVALQAIANEPISA